MNLNNYGYFAFSNYIDNLFGSLIVLSAVFLQDDNNQWYVMDASAGFDAGHLQTQITNLDSRVTTLENSGGSELYEHHIYIRYYLSSGTDEFLTFTIINNQPSMTRQNIYIYMSRNGITGTKKYIHATGAIWLNSESKMYPIIGVFYSNPSQCFGVMIYNPQPANINNTEPYEKLLSTSVQVTDTVIKIL